MEKGTQKEDSRRWKDGVAGKNSFREQQEKVVEGGWRCREVSEGRF